MAFWRPGSSLPGAAGGDDGQSDGPPGAELPGVMYNPLHRLPLHLQRQRLPVFAHHDEILYAVETHATTILVGATGSGKTTQVPQYLLEAGWAARNRVTGAPRMIVCTQPRRIAAMTIAERVASEVGSPLGTDVGYAVRFDEKWDPQRTKLKFCTDGMLLRETMLDPLLSRYSVVMLDEAHERSLETDLLLGLLKKIQRRRPDLRVVIASATLHVDTFVRFFRSKKSKRKRDAADSDARVLNDVVAVSVEGRQFPVDVEYLTSPCSDYREQAIATVLAIDAHESADGDVLVFLPGQDDIDHVVRALNDRAGHHIAPLPLYAALPLAMQQRVFLPPPRGVRRKVVVATTIAETSVTIDNVAFVVDACFAKLAVYNPLTGVEALVTAPISKAAAKQRAGRAGRTRPGKCFRLCTQSYYTTELPDETLPAIQRTDLTRVVLHLLSMGIQEIAHFAFVSPPAPEALIRALEQLYALGAIDASCRMIEPMGTHLAEFPVEPMLAKVLLTSVAYGVVDQVVSIASVLSVGDVFVSARGSVERKARVVEALGAFADPDGDHLTYLAILDAFIENDRRRDWCDEHMLSHRALTRALEVRKQLARYVQRFVLGPPESAALDRSSDATRTRIRECFTAGYFANAARLDGNGEYRTVRDARVVQLHPTSVYCHVGKSPDWVVFHTSVVTTDEFIRDVSKIDPRWLVATAPAMFQTNDVSAAVSGSSGALGLPKPSATAAPTDKPLAAETPPATAPDGRILFRKPAKRTGSEAKKTALPVHIGKSKGGLRSQF